MKKSVQYFRSSVKTKKLFFSLLVVCIVLIIVLFYSIGFFYGKLKIKLFTFSIVALVGMFILLWKVFANMNDKSLLTELNAKDFYGKTKPLSKSFGLVYWKDVVEIKLIKVGVDTLVMIIIENCEKYKGRFSPPLWDIVFNKGTNQISIMYSASEIGIDSHELFVLLNNFWLENKN